MSVASKSFDSMLKHIWYVAKSKGYNKVMFSSKQACDITGLSRPTLWSYGVSFPCSAEALANALIVREHYSKKE